MKNIFFLIFLLVVQTAQSQIPQPQKNTYVNDFANVLAPGQIKYLNNQIFDIERNSSAQLAIILVNEVPAAYDIDEYALLIGRRWHVGTNKNGIVYVAAIGQHKQSLQVAGNLYGTFNREKRTAILDELKPYFKQGDYNGGITKLVNEIGGALGTSYQNQAATTASAQTAQNSPPTGNDGNIEFYIGLAFIVLFIIIIFLAIRNARRNRMVRMNSYTSNRGFYNKVDYNQYPDQTGAGIGDFVAGAAVGYAAEQMLNPGQNPDYGPVNQNNTGGDNNSGQNSPQDYGNWGGGADNSSSSDDSGFSSDFSSDDSGSSSDW